MSNWLGKTIFGTFRGVGFSGSAGVASRGEESENEGLLHALRSSSSGDVQDPAAGSGINTDGAHTPPGILKHSGSATNTAQAGHGPGLPRPHHTGECRFCVDASFLVVWDIFHGLICPARCRWLTSDG